MSSKKNNSKNKFHSNLNETQSKLQCYIAFSKRSCRFPETFFFLGYDPLWKKLAVNQFKQCAQIDLLVRYINQVKPFKNKCFELEPTCVHSHTSYLP